MRLAKQFIIALAITAMATPTFAETTATLTGKPVQVKENTSYADYGYVKIGFDNTKEENVTFTLILENAEWPDQAIIREKIEEVVTNRKMANAMSIDTTKVFKISDTTLEISMGLTGDTTKNLYIPLHVRVGKGIMRVELESSSNAITNMHPQVFARTEQKQALVNFGTPKQLMGDGGIGDITIIEPFESAIGRTDDKITITLEDEDYYFDKQKIYRSIRNNRSSYFVFKDGFNGFTVEDKNEKDEKKQSVYVDFTPDQRQMELTFKQRGEEKPGQLILRNLPIMCSSDNKKEKYKVEATVQGGDVEKVTGIVATAEQGNIKVISPGVPATITTGNTGNINFTVQKGSYTGVLGKERMQIKLTKGYFLPYTKTDYIEARKFIQNGKINNIQSPLHSLPAEQTDLYDLLKKAVANSPTIKSQQISTVDWIWEDDRAVGIECKIAKTASQYVFNDVPVYMPMTVKDSSSVEVLVKDSDAFVQVVKIDASVEIQMDRMILKRSQKPQASGQLTIEESKKGQLIEGGTIEINLDKDTKGLRFIQKPTVTITAGNLKIDPKDITFSDNRIIIKIAKASTMASTITISQFPVQVSEDIELGMYPVTVKGSAFSSINGLDSFTFKKMIDIGLGNPIDYNPSGLRTGTSSFKIGSTSYWAQGMQKQMDVAPYLSKKGRVMLPIKYVAAALGVDGGNVMTVEDKIMIIAGNKTIVLQKGSNIALLNRVPITLDEAVAIKQGRAYIPASQIGNLLGVEAKWNQSTKTATFIN